MKLLNVGISESNPDYLNKKIFISNAVALILAFMVALPFVFISLLFFRPLTILPVVGIPVALTTLLFNYFGLHNVARTVISLVPISMAGVYQAYLSKAGQPVIPGLAMIMLSFSLIIFVVFDLRQKGLLITMSLVMTGIMLAMYPLNDRLEMPLDTQIIETGWLAKMVTVISLVSCAGIVLVLVVQNVNSEKRLTELLQQAEQNQSAMMKKELELKENLEKLAQAQQEERKRQWSNEGLAQGLIIMRNHHDMKTLGDELIKFIVKYVKANQGGLFLVNSDDENDIYLELLSMYAYERKKYLQRRVEIGQGILGQVYLDKETLNLKEIPENYIRITSGLGESLPRNIVVVPLMVNEVVYALIELASFTEFQFHEIKFLEALGESIAMHLQSIKVNMTTKRLLETSQQQAEEMRAQEEEMRQNMEELSATQEEMIRKEQEYIKRIQQLERALQETEGTQRL